MGVSVFDVLFLLKGIGMTVLLSLMTMLISIPAAFLMGFIRSIKSKNMIIFGIQYVISFGITVIKGTPLLLQLVFVFFGLPFVGFNISALNAAFISLGVYSVAYLTEIVRTGIESIAWTQWEASSSLGFSFSQTMRLVILPQAFKIMIPPTVSFFIGLIKDSSLCAVIGIVELSRAGRIIVERSHQSLLIFTIVALLYFIVCYPLSRFSQRLERNLTV